MPQRYSPSPLTTEINLSGTEGVQIFNSPQDSGGRRKYDSGKLAESLKVFAQEGLNKKGERDELAFAKGQQAYAEAQAAIGAGEDPGMVLDRLTKKLEVDPVSSAPFQRGVSKAKAEYGSTLLAGEVDSILLDLQYTDEEGQAALSPEEVRQQFNVRFQQALKDSPYLAQLQDDPFVGVWTKNEITTTRAKGEIAAEQVRRDREILFAQQGVHRSLTSVFHLFDGPISEQDQQAFAGKIGEIISSARRDNIPDVDQTFMKAALSYAKVLSKNGDNAREAMAFIAAIKDTKLGGKAIRERSEANEALLLFENSLQDQAAAADERKARQENAAISRAATRANDVLSQPEIQEQILNGADPEQFMGAYLDRLKADGVYRADLEGSMRSEFQREALSLQGREVQSDQLALQNRGQKRALLEDPAVQEDFDALVRSPFTTPDLIRAIDPTALTREQRIQRNDFLRRSESREGFLQDHESTILGPLGAVQKATLETISQLDPGIQAEAELAALNYFQEEQKALVSFADEITSKGLSQEEIAAQVREYRDRATARYQGSVNTLVQSYRSGVQDEVNAIRDAYRTGDIDAASSKLAELQRNGKIPEGLVNDIASEIRDNATAREFVRQNLTIQEGSQIRGAIDTAFNSLIAVDPTGGFKSSQLEAAVRERLDEDMKDDKFVTRFVKDYGVDMPAFRNYVDQVVNQSVRETAGGVFEQALIYQKDYAAFREAMTKSGDASLTYLGGLELEDPKTAKVVQSAIEDSPDRATRAVALALNFDKIAETATPNDLFDIYAPFFLNPDEVISGQMEVKITAPAYSGVTYLGEKVRVGFQVPVREDADWATVPIFASAEAARRWATSAEGDGRLDQLLQTTGFQSIEQLIQVHGSAGLFKVRSTDYPSTGFVANRLTIR